MMQSRSWRSTVVWVGWLGAWLLVTVFFNSLSDMPTIRIAHGVLAYLLLIIGASREAKLALSVVMVVLGYLAVDWIFVPPRHALGMPSDLDFVLLVGFVLTGAVISRLMTRLRRAAEIATNRAAEIERLSEERLALERDAACITVLNEAERLKNALIASLVHDLRTPVATICLLADPESGVASRIALDRVGEEARRLGDFLATMQRFVFVGAGDGSLLVIEPHVVDDLIGTAIRSAGIGLLGHPVRVHLPPTTELLMVNCDLTLSLQILGNLLQNASRYSPAGTPIDVTARAGDGEICITVSDRGPGLAQDELESVFKPLHRGRAAPRTEGIGMGLAISRTFARAQQGDVHYQPRPGGGAEFRLVLPASARVRAPQAELRTR